MFAWLKKIFGKAKGGDGESASPPPEAVEEAPAETAEEMTAESKKDLEMFIENCFTPVVSDGSISWAEETGLWIAYVICGIDKLPSKEVRKACQEAISEALGGDEKKGWDYVKLWEYVHEHFSSRGSTLTTWDLHKFWQWIVGLEEDPVKKKLIEQKEPSPKGKRESGDSGKRNWSEEIKKYRQWLKAETENVMAGKFVEEGSVAMEGWQEEQGEQEDAPSGTPGEVSGDEGPEAGQPAAIGAQATPESKDAPLIQKPSSRVVREKDHDYDRAPWIWQSLAEESVRQAEQVRQGWQSIAGEVLPEMEKWLGGGQSNMPFARFNQNRPEHKVIEVELDGDGLDIDEMWFIGDIHGDLLGMCAALAYIDLQSQWKKPPVVVFLGDFIDRGPYSFEVILKLFQVVLDPRRRTCVLAGNHDLGLKWSESSSFTSDTQPSEMLSQLDSLTDDRDSRLLDDIARMFIDFEAKVPWALLFSDGLIAAHGGVPHYDLTSSPPLDKEMSGLDWLNTEACCNDFVYTRLHERARKRTPNRNTKLCELGREDFEKFCDVAAAKIKKPISRMVRGHDHVKDRYKFYDRYQTNPVLTINTFCYEDGPGPYVRTPCTAKWARGKLPEVHRIYLPEDEVNRFYPKENAS